MKIIEQICRLKREKYPDFSVQHFHEHLVEKEEIELSYSWAQWHHELRGGQPLSPGVFIPEFNRRFTLAPAQRHSAFTPVPKGMDLSLLLSIKHDRVVRNDNTVIFQNQTPSALFDAQLPALRPLPCHRP
jgi:hypothetical protein